MKKILCMMLVLSFAFALFSCNKNNDSEIDGMANIINSSDPTKIVTIVNYTIGDTALLAEYITQKDTASGKSQFDYQYQRKAIPGQDEISNESIKTISGTVYCDADGNLSGSEFDSGSATGYLPYSLSLSESRLSSYEFSEDGKILDAKVASSEAVRVFGTEISADGDISLKITTNGTYLYNVEISYTAQDTGAVVSIRTSYDYAKVTLSF